jgi:hypothetical protein
MACLHLTVPSWIDRVVPASPAELALMAAESAAVLAVRHPDLAADGEDPDLAITHLARLIAIAALSLDGVTFCGQHWCVTAHPGCPGQLSSPPSSEGAQ